MTCTVCPNCGTDLERYGVIERGDLVVAPHEVRWKGRRVTLTPSQRLIVSAIVRADGVPVAKKALAEACGCDERADPANIIAVQIVRVRQAFRAIDPAFAALETIWGTGLRWAA